MFNIIRYNENYQQNENLTKTSLFPKISIVTPSYNQGEYLNKTIQSVLDQEYPNLEYIIIDGGSTDNSVEIIKKYEKYLKYWVSEADRGQSHAINKGFDLATGEILGWLNSDDLYTQGALLEVGSVDWSNADFCYGEGEWITADDFVICKYPTIRPTYYTLMHRCTLCQPTVFFKKSTYEELGKLDENLHYVFDYEYWIRSVFRSKKYTYLPFVFARSRMYKNNKSLFGVEEGEKERSDLYNRYYKSNKSYLVSRLFYYYVVYFTRKREKILHFNLKQY